MAAAQSYCSRAKSALPIRRRKPRRYLGHTRRLEMAMWDRHMALFGALLEGQQRQMALMEQMVEAITKIVPVVWSPADAGADPAAAPYNALLTAIDLLRGERTKNPPMPAQQPGKAWKRRSKAMLSVYSVADTKRPTKFYTAIRIPRAAWDEAGFDPDDRLQIDWDGIHVSVARTASGGVRVKSVGRSVVALQSSRLGDLNFKRQSYVAKGGLIRF